MRAAVFAILFTIASASTVLLGSNKCTWGPSYWCTGLSQAKECSAFDHCINVFWKNQQPLAAVQDAEVCEFCESIVTDVRQFLLSGKPQQQIETYLEKGCSILPDEYSRTTCNNVVDHYTTEAFQLINSTLDPKVICQVFELCQPSDAKKDLPQKPAGAVESASAQKPAAETTKTEHFIRKVMLQKNEPVALKALLQPAVPKSTPRLLSTAVTNIADCYACKLFVSKIRETLKTNATEDEIGNYIRKTLCSRLGSLAEECDLMVQQYLPQIVELVLKEETPEAVCEAMQLCTAAAASSGQTVLRSSLLAKMKLASSPFYAAASKLNNEACDTCEEVVNYVKIAIEDNSTQQYVLNLIKGELCSKLGSFQEECEQLIDEYGSELFAVLISELDPAQVCAAFGFCSAAKPQPQQATNSVPASSFSVKSSVSCIMCEFIIDKLEDMLNGNRTQAAIEKALGEVCTLLPATVGQECNFLVNKYGPTIVDVLLHMVSSDTVCAMIGACTSSSSSSHAKVIPKVAGDSVECQLCKYVVQYAALYLSQNATQEEIMNALEDVCSHLTTLLVPECKAVVENYGPIILELLRSELDPVTICTEFGMCAGSTQHVDLLRSNKV